MSEFREQIAKAIALCQGLCEWTNWDTLPQVYKDELFYPLADQILAFFREAIEGLKPLSDEEIGEAGDWRYAEGELYADCVDCGLDTERVRAVTQAQVDDIKRQLFEILEGKCQNRK